MRMLPPTAEASPGVVSVRGMHWSRFPESPRFSYRTGLANMLCNGHWQLVTRPALIKGFSDSWKRGDSGNLLQCIAYTETAPGEASAVGGSILTDPPLSADRFLPSNATTH